MPVLVALLGASCRHVSQAAPVPARGEAQCYAAERSLVFPLGDTAHTAPGKTGAWLILEPKAFAPGTTTRKAHSIDALGHEQGGVWWQSGDTLLVQTHDLFTTNSLTLVKDQVGRMRGVGAGTTDVLVQVGDGYEPVQQRWVAELRAISCWRVLSEPQH